MLRTNTNITINFQHPVQSLNPDGTPVYPVNGYTKGTLKKPGQYEGCNILTFVYTASDGISKLQIGSSSFNVPGLYIVYLTDGVDNVVGIANLIVSDQDLVVNASTK